jgi:hypothetical protein
MPRTLPHCCTLPPCRTLLHPATHCRTLLHTAALPNSRTLLRALPYTASRTVAHCCRLQCHILPLALSHCRTARTTTHCRTLPHIAALPDSRTLPRALPHTVACTAAHCCAHCRTPPLALLHIFTLQHTATHCRAHCHIAAHCCLTAAHCRTFLHTAALLDSRTLPQALPHTAARTAAHCEPLAPCCRTFLLALPQSRENLKLGLRTTQLFRGFTILGFYRTNGAKTRDKVNSCTIASVITFK